MRAVKVGACNKIDNNQFVGAFNTASIVFLEGVQIGPGGSHCYDKYYTAIRMRYVFDKCF